MKVNGIPFDQGKHPQGKLAPAAVVLHRTYGALGKDTYKGAYSIGKNGRGGVGIGFHFLIGKKNDQAVQFYDTTTEAAHAKGANTWAIGIEFDGVNEDVLTDWQVNTAAIILAACSDAHGIPLTYYDGPRMRVPGVLPHASVPRSDHTDRVTRSDWERIMAATRRPACQCPPEKIAAPSSIDWAAVRRLAAAEVLNAGLGTLPVLRSGDRSLYAVVLQKALNLVAGRGLAEDGQYGPATEAAVRDFQRFLRIPVSGVFDAVTRMVLTTAVIRIQTGVG